ncbi:MAG: NAD+ synthase [Phycisphaerales bacterium]|nr:NAD+ synthase [Phycisphaerales bacterium]
MRLALAQINPTIGDLQGNVARIADFAGQANAAGADLVVFPELCLSGYPPKDLLIQNGFLEACAAAAKRVGKSASNGLTLVFGTPLPVRSERASGEPAWKGGIANALVVYRDGAYVDCYDKRLLPTYDVFDEDRYFTPGDRAVAIDVRGFRVGLSICEDLWRGEDVGFSSRYADTADPVEDLVKSTGCRLIINPSASPFLVDKGRRHREILTRHARRHGVFVAAVNQVGGNDELVFDGHAAVFGPNGRLVAAAKGFEEQVLIAEIDPSKTAPRECGSGDPLLDTPVEEQVFRALVLGERDYCRKTGFSRVLLGLSGGIDSAVACVLSVAALGPSNVLGVSLPSRYSSQGSKDDAAALAERLGVPYTTIPIESAFNALERSLGPVFAGRPADAAEENIQSRVRGTILMAISNKLGHLVVTTGNKSELAVGYCTLYGDMNGGLAVLSDLSKQWVYRLARWMNDHWRALEIEGLTGPPIPEASITKAPSAELRPDQTDQDSLPPYDVLDQIIEGYVERRESPAEIVARTRCEPAMVAKIVRLIDLSEYKRKQAATGLKVTGVAFGSGRRVPIAQRYRPERELQP